MFILEYRRDGFCFLIDFSVRFHVFLNLILVSVFALLPWFWKQENAASWTLRQTCRAQLLENEKKKKRKKKKGL